MTAKHILAATAGDKATVQICESKTSCEDLEVSILRCKDPIDIAVLVPPKLVSVTYLLPPDSGGMAIGQDVYFVGFPYADYALTTNNGTEAIGFVRKGVFSAQETTNDYMRLYLDGRNNSGFSGGPVVFLPQGKPGHFKVGGVISGYRSDLTEVMKLEPIDAGAITQQDRARNAIVDMADGTHRKLVGTGNAIAENTGIVVSYDIKHAVDLIKTSGAKGPVGP